MLAQDKHSLATIGMLVAGGIVLMCGLIVLSISLG